jgi:hypothetical protein
MNENLTTNPEELQGTLSADQAETTEKAEQTAQSSEVADKNAKEGENIPAKIASPAVVTATPPSPPLPPDGKSKRGCWSILWWCLKAMVRHWRITFFILLVALIGYGAMVAYRTLTNSNDAVDKPIEQSPEEIMRLQAIGQWEFLSVEAEELVERHYSGLMSERDLVCIYRGTLRIGVDMRKLPSDWVEMKERSAILHLPQPSLLDENFLDESRTTVFFEQGVFRPEERDAMRTEAKDKMKQRAMTTENLSIARRNAEAQFQKLFLAMGYEDVVVEFDANTATQNKN